MKQNKWFSSLSQFLTRNCRCIFFIFAYILFVLYSPNKAQLYVKFNLSVFARCSGWQHSTSFGIVCSHDTLMENWERCIRFPICGNDILEWCEFIYVGSEFQFNYGSIRIDGLIDSWVALQFSFQWKICSRSICWIFRKRIFYIKVSTWRCKSEYINWRKFLVRYEIEYNILILCHFYKI